jgi:hypothetical protein
LKRRQRAAAGNIGSSPMSRSSYWMTTVAFTDDDPPDAIQ